MLTLRRALQLGRPAFFALLFALVGASPASGQLVVAVEANPGIAKPGEQLEVRITVANQGAADVGAWS